MTTAYIQGMVRDIETKQTSKGSGFAKCMIDLGGKAGRVPVTAWHQTRDDLVGIGNDVEVRAIIRIKGREWPEDSGKWYPDLELTGVCPVEGAAPDRAPDREQPALPDATLPPDDANLPF
jgi:hypothetical protein